MWIYPSNLVNDLSYFNPPPLFSVMSEFTVFPCPKPSSFINRQNVFLIGNLERSLFCQLGHFSFKTLFKESLNIQSSPGCPELWLLLYVSLGSVLLSHWRWEVWCNWNVLKKKPALQTRHGTLFVDNILLLLTFIIFVLFNGKCFSGILNAILYIAD